MGVPEMEALWNDLSTRKQTGELAKAAEKVFQEVGQSS